MVCQTEHVDKHNKVVVMPGFLHHAQHSTSYTSFYPYPSFAQSCHWLPYTLSVFIFPMLSRVVGVSCFIECVFMTAGVSAGDTIMHFDL